METINNCEFEVIRSNTKQGQDIIRTYHHWTQSWDELYKKPSSEKEAIKKHWEQFFAELGVYGLGYRGNSMIFSIYAKDGERYFHITKSHNYVVYSENSNQSYDWNCLNIK